MDKLDELINHKLRLEDLDKMVHYQGAMEHAHIVWVEGALAMARECASKPERSTYTKQ